MMMMVLDWICGSMNIVSLIFHGLVSFSRGVEIGREAMILKDVNVEPRLYLSIYLGKLKFKKDPEKLIVALVFDGVCFA